MIVLYLAEEFCHFEAAIQYNTGAFRRNIYMLIDDFAIWRRINAQHGLFTTAYRYDNEDIRNARMIGNLYLDFDISDIDEGDNFQMVREDVLKSISALGGIFGIAKDMIQIFFSGKKGIHLVVPAEIFGIQPHTDLNMIFKSIAVDLNKLVSNGTIDTGIYDRVRLFRVPNSLHPNTGLYKIQITYDELRNRSLDELKVLAREPRKPLVQKRQFLSQANRLYNDYIRTWDDEQRRKAASQRQRGDGKLNFMPPCIEHLLNTPVPETVGQRNNKCAVLASYYMQSGASQEEAVDALIQWSSQYCQPALPASEIRRTAASIYRSERRYGCQALKELSECSTDCRLHESKRRN